MLADYQDTFYVGNLKGIGRIYQHTSKVAFARLYDRKNALTALRGRAGRRLTAGDKVMT